MEPGFVSGPGLSYAWTYNGTNSNLPTPTFTDVTCDSELSLTMTRTYVVDGVVLLCASTPMRLALTSRHAPRLTWWFQRCCATTST